MKKRKNKKEALKQELVDALDQPVGEKELRQLEVKTKAHDPALWEDYLWFSKQRSRQGVFGELSAMRSDEPGRGAIQRFHQRRKAEEATGADLETLVWSWFQRYVLTVGIVLIILFAGLHLGENGVSEANGREEVEQFLGWNQEELPEPDHWLYEDF